MFVNINNIGISILILILTSCFGSQLLEPGLSQTLRSQLPQGPPLYINAKNSLYHKNIMYKKLGARHPPPVFLGYDLRLRPVGVVRRLWRSGQYLLHLQSQN